MYRFNLPAKLLAAGSGLILLGYYVLILEYLIILPVALLTLIISLFVIKISAMNKETATIFEIGPLYALIVFVYAIFPLSFYILNGMQFSIISDERLFLSSPTPKEMAEIAWYYVAYLFCFSIAYFLLRSKKISVMHNFHGTRSKDCDAVFFAVSVFLYILLNIFLALVAKLYHLNDVADYSNTYLSVWQLPTFLRQIYNHSLSIKMTLQLILLVGLIRNFDKNKYIIFVWLLLELVTSSLALQSRTGLMFLFLSSAFAYHYFVKPIKLTTLFFISFSMLLLFTVLGQLRTGSDIFLKIGLLTLLTHNEFEAVFGTLFHFNNNSISSPINFDISWLSVWTADILNLIPSQLLPFDKIDLGHLYTEHYVPELLEMGGNFPGGTLLEAMLGLGLFDACLKGLVVGFIFAYIHRSCILGKNSFAKSVFYIWVTVLSYKAFSRGTFMLVPAFFYDFLLPVVFIYSFSALVKGAVASSNRPTEPSVQEIQ